MKNYYIKIDGNIVNILPKQSVTLERYNPIFDFGLVRGSKILDYMLPFSPRNDKIFGYYGLHQSRYLNKKYYCEKYADGILIEKGFIQLQEVTDEGYSVFFTQNLGEVFGDYQNTPLNRIDFGKAPLPSAGVIQNYDYLIDDYALPAIKNSAFYGVNHRQGFDGYINSPFGGQGAVPMFGFPFLFRKIGELCNFSFSGEFFDSDWYKRGLIENTFALDELTKIDIKNHLWEMTIPEMLKGLKSLFNLSLFFDTTNRVLTIRFSDDLMRMPTKLNYTSKVQPSYNRVPLRDNRIELDWDLDKDDNLMKVPPSYFLKYTSPQGNDSGTLFSIKTPFSTRMTDPVTGLAMAEQIGQSSLFNQLSAKNTPKILLWNGIVNGIPTATNQFGDLRLAWNGTKTLSNSQYAEYEKWRSRTASRSVQANLSASDLAKLDIHRRAGEYTSMHIHGRDYYVDSLRVNLPLAGYTTLQLWER